MQLLRFLVTRILAALPVLLVLSVVTFAIIQAPPGDYGDYIRSDADQPGRGDRSRKPRTQADDLPRAERPQRAAAGPVRQLDGRHRHPLRFRPLAVLQQAPSATWSTERLPRTILLALACHFFASVIGIGMGIIAATRQYSWIDTSFGIISFLGMTVPQIPAGADHHLRPRLQAERAGTRQLLLVALWRRAVELGQVRQPRPAHLAGGLHRHLRRPRLQHAGDARQPARRAQCPVCRDGPGQGPDRERRDHEACRAQRAASAHRLPGRGAALHAHRRDRGRHRLRPRHRRSGHRRLHGRGRRLCHRHLRAGPRRDADHRQHHRRSPARRRSIRASVWVGRTANEHHRRQAHPSRQKLAPRRTPSSPRPRRPVAPADASPLPSPAASATATRPMPRWSGAASAAPPWA